MPSATDQAEPLPRISAIDVPIRRFVGEFSDPAQERAFRQASLRGDARQFFVLLAVVLPANAFWLISDYVVSESGPSFGLMLAVRSTIILVGVVSVFASLRTRSIGVFSALVMTATIVAIGGIFFFDMTRPMDYLGHYTIDILVIVALYFAAPIPLRLQATTALLYTAAMLWFYVEFKQTPYDALYNFNIPVSATLANMVGYIAARSLAVRRRAEFYLLERESMARVDLQEALDNIRTLSGLLPICAGCKKIRDDKGYWNHVEAYIGERSAVEFTHGLCPECKDIYMAADQKEVSGN